MAKGERKVIYRDSKDGQFIKKSEADRRPSTTEKQHVPVVPPGKGKK